MIQLRPYQEEALGTVLDACLEDRFLLLQAGTGAGKTILFSSLIKHCITTFDMRVAVIAHREILVRQAYEKLLQVWPEGRDLIGIACASVSSKADLTKPVLIASPQTLVNRLDKMDPIHWVILDECHRVPPKNKTSQYRTMLEKMEKAYPDLRVLGVTATPFRLGHGFIYGDKASAKNWWSKMHCQISIGTLQESGFLVPYRAKEAEDISTDLQSVKKTGGDYNMGDLEDVMTKKVHIQNAVTAVERHAADRKSIVVFCTTIKHAETVSEAFRDSGQTSACVHSMMDSEERRANLGAFDAGDIRVICNVGVLTEGWDSTGVDCIVMCRPTMSPALYVQIVGRGLRLHEGKDDCLILDLSGNCMKHGDPNDPLIEIPGKRKPREQEKQGKTCPECQEIVSPGIFECPGCGYQWERPVVVESKGVTEFRDVKFKSASAPSRLEVQSWRMEDYTSKAGNRMAKLTIYCKSGGIAPVVVNHFLDFDGAASSYGQRKAREWWTRVADPVSLEGNIPLSVDDAMSFLNCIENFPTHITVAYDGKYHKVVSW